MIQWDDAEIGHVGGKKRGKISEQKRIDDTILCTSDIEEEVRWKNALAPAFRSHTRAAVDEEKEEKEDGRSGRSSVSFVLIDWTVTTSSSPAEKMMMMSSGPPSLLHSKSQKREAE